MNLHFEAETVEIEDTGFGVLAVGFYSEENYLMIQQSLEESDEQSIKSGPDSYHIERDDQSYGGYGGVERITISTNSIEVELNETGCQNLDCEAVQVDFETDAETYELLVEKLTGIFGNRLILK